MTNLAKKSQEKVDANLLKLESILSKMRELYKNRIPNDPEGYEKALNVFENHIDRLQNRMMQSYKKQHALLHKNKKLSSKNVIKKCHKKFS